MENCGFFDAKLNGDIYDRQYLSASFAKFFSSFIANGIFPNPSDGMQILATESHGMQIQAMPGQGWINGYWYENTEKMIKNMPPAHGSLNRKDLIILRWSSVNRKISLEIIQGTPAIIASPPSYTRNENNYDLVLAIVTIPAGLTGITQTNINDTRLNNTLCGVVHGVVEQVDTTTIFNQFQDWYTSKTGIWESDWNAWWQNNAVKYAENWITWWANNPAKYENAWTTWWNDNPVNYKTAWTTWFDTVKANSPVFLSEFNERLDKIQVGGRNYILNSDEQKVVQEGSFVDFIHTIPEKFVITGELRYYVVTIVFDTIPGKIKPFSTIVVADDTALPYDEANVGYYNYGSKKYTQVFSIDGTNNENLSDKISVLAAPGSFAGCFISEIKLEVGTKASSMTIAQEDVQAQIASLWEHKVETSIGTTEQRPDAPRLGEPYYDTTLTMPMWWNGDVWKDAKLNKQAIEELEGKPREAIDLNYCYTAGWYAGTNVLHSPITGAVKVLVIPYSENSTYCTQLAFGTVDNSASLMFIRTDFGAWHKIYTDARDNLEELKIPVIGNNELEDTATYYPSYWTIGGTTISKMKGMLTGVRSTEAFSPAARYDYTCTIGETYTLSAWVRSNVAGTIASITSSGWVAADINASKNTLVVANKWYRYKFTFTATDSNSKAFALESNIACTFDVCGMQLEKGTAATGYAKNVWDKIM